MRCVWANKTTKGLPQWGTPNDKKKNKRWQKEEGDKNIWNNTRGFSVSCIKRALMLGIFKTPPVAQTHIRFNEGFVAL